MLRKILCNFEFTTPDGRIFKAYDFYLGDTAEPKTVRHKDFTPEIVCQSLKMSEEALAKRLNTSYWDINRDKLEQNGFTFRLLEIFFYPDPKKN
ncbi:MAG: hypothetical protein LBM71_02630 [Elusimicrobiota bacterium]|jgi:hypothetical protein|nr:hypothetical protein [Elusimicrobiota bacterium]